MFIKNCWYVAGWASEVTSDKFLARTLVGVPVVMWRTDDGKIVAFEDRCCHRGAPLSLGRREGDFLRCMYHGLKFDRNGACVEIPAQDRIPESVRVNTFPIVEQHKWLWIWMGDPAKADRALIPDTHWLTDPAWRHLEGYTHYDTDYLLIADNLLDLAHLPYVHEKTLGGSAAYAESPAQIEPLENGVRVTRWAMSIEAPPFVQKVKHYDGKMDRWNKYDFTLPGIFLMDSGMAPEGTGAVEGRRENAAEFRGCQAITPETDHSTHYFFCHPHNFAIDQPQVTASIHQSVVTAFDEDRRMISAQAHSLDLMPDFKMIPIRADRALGLFRALVKKVVEEEAKAYPSQADRNIVATETL